MALQVLNQQDVIRIVLKRKWWILASVMVCLGLALAAWPYIPKKYRSATLVTIDSPKVAQTYVKGLANEARPYEDPLVYMMQQITISLTNRAILGPVIESLKPYPGMTNASLEDQMKVLRRGIVVSRPKDSAGVVISYDHSDPHMAQAVAALIATKLREENLKQREGVVENTTEFLAAEMERAKADLEAKERLIGEFKRAHMGELPQQIDANLKTLDRVQADLAATSDALGKLGERLTSIEKAIKEYSELGTTTALTPNFDRDRRIIDPRAARIRELRQKLTELSATYKESYPDIVHLKEEIGRLESLPSVDPALLGGEDAIGIVKGEDPSVVSKKVSDPYLRELIKQRSEIKSDMTLLKEKQAHGVRQIRELEGRVERTPAREQSLAVLQRDYENMQKNYQALLDKRLNAKILENYESRQFGEQYRIIEAASFPYGPEPPTFIQVLLGGLALGCLIGLGGALGVELTKTGFRRPEEVETYLGIPVIASIPSFSSATSGIGMMQSRALLAGPTTPTTSVGGYLGYRGKSSSTALARRGAPLNPSRGLPPKFHLIAKWGPASLMAEQYRVAATRLLLMTSDKKNAVTLVTSSVMGEGKTTTAVNLAYILAHDLSKSTLLIDCDLKRPMVHEYVGIPPGPGLADVLQETTTVDNALHRFEDLPLWILPAGSPKVRPIGLSVIQHLKKILPELQRRYDHIILDAPPILPLADVNVLSSMADMLAFVVRAGGTEQDIARKALRMLGETDNAGIILTQVEMEYAPYFMYAAPYVNEDSGNRT